MFYGLTQRYVEQDKERVNGLHLRNRQEVLQRFRSKSSPLEKPRSKLANPVKLSWGFYRFRPELLICPGFADWYFWDRVYSKRTTNKQNLRLTPWALLPFLVAAYATTIEDRNIYQDEERVYSLHLRKKKVDAFGVITISCGGRCRPRWREVRVTR